LLRLHSFPGRSIWCGVDDPFTKTTATIDEYCAGNRVVTVRGSKVAIADYDAQQLTEIDHAAQTWSVTSFADIARSRTDLDARIGNKTPVGDAKVTAMSADAYSIDAPHRRTQIAFNRGVLLSRAAAEVLIGATYPNVKNSKSEGILTAAGNGGTVSAMSSSNVTDDIYGLLVESDFARPKSFSARGLATIHASGGRAPQRASRIHYRDLLALSRTVDTIS
jgi:hypothetical protein